MPIVKNQIAKIFKNLQKQQKHFFLNYYLCLVYFQHFFLPDDIGCSITDVHAMISSERLLYEGFVAIRMFADALLESSLLNTAKQEHYVSSTNQKPLFSLANQQTQKSSTGASDIILLTEVTNENKMRSKDDPLDDLHEQNTKKYFPKRDKEGIFKSGWTKLLRDSFKYVESIQLISLRVEVFENLFSLLFARSQDITVQTFELFAFENQQTLRCSANEVAHVLEASQSPLTTVGFLATAEFVKEAIDLLKDSIAKTSRELTESEKTELVSQKSAAGILVSVPEDCVKKRLSKLQFYVSEAQWKYELVTGQDMFEEGDTDSSQEFYLSGKSSPMSTCPAKPRRNGFRFYVYMFGIR